VTGRGVALPPEAGAETNPADRRSSAMSDTEAVCDTLYRFAEGLDLRDWELYRSVFTDEIEIDYTSHRPGSAGTMPADDWVERGRARLSPLDATQHSMTNPRVILSEDDPDRATCTMYIQAQHILTRADGPASYLLGGRYVDQLVRQDGTWRIRAVALQVRWAIGDPSVVGLPS
jgi:3-phenylpropionate/cinnamic acid dioxygenase small subunit